MGELKEKLVPFQLALGVRDAGAALATLAQGIFEQGRKGGPYCTDQLGLDLKNAFGTVSRVRIHEALREHCPSLMRWFLIAYGGTSPILHSTWGLMDREVEVGIKQGDPLSMLLMAVVMVRPLHVINELIYDKGHEHRLAIDGDEEVQGLNLLGAEDTQMMYGCTVMQRYFFDTWTTSTESSAQRRAWSFNPGSLFSCWRGID